MANGKKSAKKKKTANQAAQTKREVWGVIVIALGLFLGASMYFDAVGILGKAISGFIFGMFGIAGYAVPVGIIAAGVLLIVFSEGDLGVLPAVLSIISIVAILSIIHIARRPDAVEGMKALDYYKDAYTLGFTYREGGGIFGALVAYPALLLMGRIGSYILFIACIMVSFLLITRLSIKNAGAKLGQSIRTGVSAANERIAEHKQAVRAQQQSLYTEDITEEVLSGASIAKQKKKPTASKKSGKKGNSFEDNIFTLDSSFNQKAEPIPEPLPVHKTEPVRPNDDEDDGPEFMPTKGQIRKRAMKEKAVEEAFDRLDEETVNVDYFHDFQPDEDNRIIRNAPAKAENAAADIPVYEPVEPAPAKPAQPEYEAEEIEDIPSSAAPVVDYQRPPYSLLNSPASDMPTGNESPQEKAKLLIDTLATFNIPARIINISVGPVITRFELQPAQGIRVNRITSLSQDIALALAAPLVRIEAPIPGKAAIGIEIPNKNAAQVLLREVIESKEFQSERSPISFALGKDIAGRIVCANLEKMPHLLIGGTTGSGKSVCMNSLIISLLYKAKPEEVKLIMIDPKMVELGIYNGIPHLLIPVVTDPKKAAGSLQWAVTEMMRRYRMMADAGVRDLESYNKQARASADDELEPMPQIVVVIDELADLMLVAAKEVEESICRIAQMGRASGIHLVIATQRPSADVITGLMKANIPSRIAFAVSSAMESRIILDTPGAEKLVGKGDMLFAPLGQGKPKRVQGCFISDEEVAEVVASVKQNAAADYDDQVMAEIEQHAANADKKGKSSGAAGAYPGGEEDGEEQDERFEDGVEAILEVGQASVSMLQRRLKLGYARAARLMDQIEAKGIVGPSEGAKPRQILITKDQWRQMQSGQPLGEELLPAEDPLPPVEEEILTFDPVPQDFLE